MRFEEEDALAANEPQSERLHTFSHDLKNRLTGLWEALRQLGENQLSPEDRADLMAYAERAYFNAQRDLEDLMDDLRVDRKVIMGEPRPFDPADAFAEASRNEAYRLGKKEQALRLSSADGTMVNGDAHWTSRILEALISNASKFSPPGSTIDVRIRKGAEGCVIEVSDSGCGLSPEDLRNLFTRYAILSSRSTAGEPQARGTLARARQWAEAQGGTLDAASTGPGKGTTFTLTLPAAE